MPSPREACGEPPWTQRGSWRFATLHCTGEDVADRRLKPGIAATVYPDLREAHAFVPACEASAARVLRGQRHFRPAQPQARPRGRCDQHLPDAVFAMRLIDAQVGDFDCSLALACTMTDPTWRPPAAAVSR